MKIKVAFIFFALVIGVGGLLGFQQIKTLKEELAAAQLTNESQSKSIKSLNNFFQKIGRYYSNQNHQHTDYAEEDHLHYDYSESSHEHNYADSYHSHGRYASQDEFEMLQINFRALQSSFDLHQYSSNKHHRH